MLELSTKFRTQKVTVNFLRYITQVDSIYYAQTSEISPSANGGRPFLART